MPVHIRKKIKLLASISCEWGQATWLGGLARQGLPGAWANQRAARPPLHAVVFDGFAKAATSTPVVLVNAVETMQQAARNGLITRTGSNRTIAELVWNAWIVGWRLAEKMLLDYTAQSTKTQYFTTYCGTWILWKKVQIRSAYLEIRRVHVKTPVHVWWNQY